MNESQQDVVVELLAKMKGLGVLASPTGVVDGPVVTGYKFKLPDHLPVSKLAARAEDLALAVGVQAIDIRRIGTEVILFVPNKERRVVSFTDALTWYLKDEVPRSMNLPIMLGTNFRGEFQCLELTEMPHILIAGSTGSGKSVFESAIIAALSTAKSPAELHLYLVDTKQVDLTLFKELEHVKEMVSSIEKWYQVIKHLQMTVQLRLKELSNARVRNIKEYNNMNAGFKMPYIVIVIDELADLIEHDKAVRQENPDHDEPKVVDSIKRLVQICRATGIHIIACTQRTSVDIVSGTIKANFPARISLRLPTGIDSRTILGTNGAENLLGKGDMLVQKPDSDGVERFHGPFVRLDDIAQILEHQDVIKQMLGVQ